MSGSRDQRPACYVSMPFGRKLTPDGQELDFDSVYLEGIRPALESAGLNSVRADALVTRASILKATFEAILNSEFMIADITGNNPNVFYELGIRHAVAPRTTAIVISRMSQLPFDLAQLPVVRYDAVNGKLQNADVFIERLRSLIEQRAQHPSVDSPLYEFFPELTIGTQGSRKEPAESLRTKAESFRQHLVETRRLQQQDALPRLRDIEHAAEDSQALDSSLGKDLLLAYRDAGSWQDVVRLYDRLPPENRGQTFFVQQAAMALNRRHEPGDRSRATQMLQNLLGVQGTSAETCGILGRIYKDQFEETHDPADLERAITAYRQGHVADPNDYYSAINLVSLLDLKDDEDARQEMTKSLGSVRTRLRERLKSGPVDYWEVAALLELAVLARDWSEAQSLVAETRVRAPAPWMLESTARQIGMIGNRLSDPADRSRLRSIMAEFRAEAVPGERA